MIELVKIERQKNDMPFAQALSRIRTGDYTEEDLRLIQENCSISQQEARNLFKDGGLVYMTYLNKVVDEFNKEAMKQLPNPTVSLVSQDTIAPLSQAAAEKLNEATDWLSNKRNLYSADQTGGLVGELFLVVGLRAEITSNLDTSDGLTNGAGGTVRLISDDKTQVWIEFEIPEVGHQCRNAKSDLCKQQAKKWPNVDCSKWTPIQRISSKFRILRNRFEVTRRQFPIRAAAAKTGHRSQGQTFPRAIADFQKCNVAHMAYVMLSRVTSLKGLKVVDFDRKVIRYDANVLQEMQRLKSAENQLQLIRPQIGMLKGTKVLYHNIVSLCSHHPDILAEENLLDSSVLIFAESRVSVGDNFPLPGFDHVEFPDQSSHLGLAVYAKNALRGFKRQVSKMSATDTVEIVQFNIAQARLIAVYKSPNGDLGRLLGFLDQILCTTKAKQVIITGDFNVERPYASEEEEQANPLKPSTAEMKSLGAWMKQHNFTLADTGPGGTTDHGSQIDHIWSKKPLKFTTALDSYYSDHKMLLMTI